MVLDVLSTAHKKSKLRVHNGKLGWNFNEFEEGSKKLKKAYQVSRQIYWLPNFGQGLDLICKMVKQMMNLENFQMLSTFLTVIYKSSNLTYFSLTKFNF